MKKLNESAYFERLKVLSLGVSPSHDSPSSTSDLIEWKRAGDGCAYGIIKENSKYFIKRSTKQGTNLCETDFLYIGGLENKLVERNDSYSSALKRLKGKINAINETFGEPDESNESEDEGVVGTEEVPVENEEAPTPENGGGDEDVKDSVDNEGEEPVDGEGEEPVDGEGEEPVDGEEEESVDSEDEVDETPVEDVEDQVNNGEGDNSDEDVESEIQSMIGKLTQLMRKERLSSSMYKSVMNSIISAVDFDELDSEDIKNLSLRIKTGGKKISKESREPGLYDLEEILPESDIEEIDMDYEGIEVLPSSDGSVQETLPEPVDKGKMVKLNLKDETLELTLENEQKLRRYIRKKIQESLRK